MIAMIHQTSKEAIDRYERQFAWMPGLME